MSALPEAVIRTCWHNDIPVSVLEQYILDRPQLRGLIIRQLSVDLDPLPRGTHTMSQHIYGLCIRSKAVQGLIGFHYYGQVIDATEFTKDVASVHQFSFDWINFEINLCAVIADTVSCWPFERIITHWTIDIPGEQYEVLTSNNYRLSINKILLMYNREPTAIQRLQWENHRSNRKGLQAYKSVLG